MSAMTKTDLEAAQFALLTYREAHRLADKIDPKRERQDDVARAYDSIAGLAKVSYWSLTGRWIDENTSLIDLSTETPAEWTKNVEQSR